MNRKTVRNALLLILAAALWGGGFVASSIGGHTVGSYTYCCIRFAIGGLVLLPLVLLRNKKTAGHTEEACSHSKKEILLGGLVCGAFLALSVVPQQMGLSLGTSAGKAGFLTACYIVLVPILGLFFGRRAEKIVWFAAGLACVGLYLLCMSESLTFQLSDLLVLLCAFMCAAHILAVDRFVKRVDPIKLSCLQFFFASAMSAVLMILTETRPFAGGTGAWLATLRGWNVWLPLLYSGVLASGVAYTLQLVGQQGIHPAVASLLMSPESVFSAIFGWLILHQNMSGKEVVGCVLIFGAVILAQIPMSSLRKLLRKKA